MTYEDFPYIYEQYNLTNLSKLLDGISKIKKEHLAKPLEMIKSDLMDLQTSKGNALDEWGRLLNFNRYIAKLTPEEYNSLEKDFTPDDYKFFNKNADDTYATLSDDAYRIMLQFIYQSQNIYINSENLTLLLNGFFNLDTVILEKEDNIMAFEVYYFLENLPVWQKMIFTKFDTIPRPAGVQLKFKQGSYRYFGFETNDKDYNLKKVGNFNNSIFYK